MNQRLVGRAAAPEPAAPGARATYNRPMFRLTREVRFAVNAVADDQLGSPPANGHGGFPSLTGLGCYFSLQVTLGGSLDARSQCLLNIKQVDQAVREAAIPAIEQAARSGAFGGGASLTASLLPLLRPALHGAEPLVIELYLSPFLSYAVFARELPMVRLSQMFEFSASHRLHNPALTEGENARLFGKCSNPHGHGHNYQVKVTITGAPDENGLLISIPRFERIVASAAIERLDHKNLNIEVEAFRGVIPTVENIAQVVFRMLLAPLADAGARLAGVTVWETPKTWCEYAE